MQVSTAVEKGNVAILWRIIPVRFPDLANGKVVSLAEREKVERAWRETGIRESEERILRLVADHGTEASELAAAAKEYRMGQTTIIHRANAVLERMGRNLE
ncbi:MAG: hypothetical protein AAB407_03170 [Patescibacteria group bacterium]